MSDHSEANVNASQPGVVAQVVVTCLQVRQQKAFPWSM